MIPKVSNGSVALDERTNPLDHAVMQRDKKILEQVRQAINTRRVLMAYQPIVSSSDPSKPVFYEALARVLDRSGRIIPAAQFIDAIESTETGRLLDCVALEQGLETLKKNPDLRISINMSARSIGYMRWLRILKRALVQDAELGKRLILEITEQSAMTVPELVCGFMSGLQNKGISFAIDDFGSGHTSFRYLKDFYFDILKIDGQFIKDIAHDIDNQIICRSIISMADQFGMLSVAERVEKRQDAMQLMELDVGCMQGYLFGAPTVRPPWVQKAPALLQTPMQTPA